MLVQMNTRIDDKLKRQGDEVFADTGYSPSQAVRALWSFAAKHRADSATVASLMAKLEGNDSRAEAASLVKKIQESSKFVERLMEEQGLSLETEPDPLSYDELRDRMLTERYAERGLL